MTTDPNTLQRKAINTSGRLGSFYEVSRDELVKTNSLKATKFRIPDKCWICEVFPGDQSTDLISYLKKMDFDDALRQSILLGIIKLSGVSSFLNYDQPVDEKTRFLYCSYRSKEEKLLLTAGKANEIIPSPPPTSATHMITRIVWGFEILCVIPIPDDQPVKMIDNLLEKIAHRLNDNESDSIFTENEKNQIAKLINVTVYGSDTCIDNSHPSLLTILNRLKDWQKHENFHHPLLYSMNSLRWLYNDNQYPESFNMDNQIHSHMEKIQPFIVSIDKLTRDVKRLFEKNVEKFSDSTSNEQLIDFKQIFDNLSKLYKECRKELKRTVRRVRLNESKSVEIDRILTDQRHSSLKSDFDKLYQQIQEWLRKSIMIQRLNKHKIRYVEISELLSHGNESSTFEDIDEILRKQFQNNNCQVLLWCSSDKLERRKTEQWNEIFEKMVLKQQDTTQETSLFYVNFDQRRDELKDFKTVSILPADLSATPQSKHSKSKIS